MPINKDHFYTLASDLETERIAAAVSLVKELAQEEPSSPDWDYATDRLLAGLASNRNSARLGFSLALTEVVALRLQQGTLTVESYLEQLSNKQTFKNGKEERACLFGRLFGLQALLNEPCFSIVTEKFELLVNELCAVAATKNWIREPALFTLFGLCQRRKADPGHVIAVLKEHKMLFTNEGLALTLLLKPQDNGWPENSVFGNLQQLKAVLQDVYEDTAQKNWSPRLHFVWGLVAPVALQENFAEFWRVVVDEGFFSEKASQERKYLGMLILQLFIDTVETQDQLRTIFSQNAMRCLINHASDKKRMLYKIAQQVLKSLVVGDWRSAVVVDELLFGSNGSCDFDKLTKTKTVDGILRQCEPEFLPQLVKVLTQASPSKKRARDSDVSMEKISHTCLDALLHLVRYHKSEIDSWCDKIVKHCVLLSFFKPQHPVAAERLNSILAELPPPYTTMALTYVVKLQKKQELALELDETIKNVLDKAWDVISSSDDTRSLLLAMLSLQLYAGEDVLVTLEEILDEEQTNMVEILLGLVAQKSALLKRVSMAVWEGMLVSITSDDLEVLVQTLATKENLAGAGELFDNDEIEIDEEEEDKKDEDDEDENSDDFDSESDDSDSESEEDEDESAKKIDFETVSALAKALQLPENAISADGEVNYDALGESEEDDGSEASEDDMDDAQMLALDSQLSNIFTARREALEHIPTGNNRKKQVQDAREQVVFFKSRVLDLLEAYVKHAEKDTKQLWHGIVVPLLQCMAVTMDKIVCEKASKLLKRVTKLRPIENEEIESALRQVHAMMQKKPGQFPGIFYSTVSGASLFLAKNVDLNTVIDLYAESMKNWSGNLPGTVFFDFVGYVQGKKH